MRLASKVCQRTTPRANLLPADRQLGPEQIGHMARLQIWALDALGRLQPMGRC